MRTRPRLELVPHPKAPLYSRPDRELVLAQVIEEMASGDFDTHSRSFREAVRQTGLVNQWFFLRFIGQFDLLNEDLHVDMCNFRQSLLAPGSRGAMFLPRGHLKTTIVTEGTGWEFVRDPSLTARFTHAKEERAGDFHETIVFFFEKSDMAKWLYPEFTPLNANGLGEYGKKRLILPNRPRYSRAPNLSYGGVEGASESVHVYLHVIDDMLGLKTLNAQRQSNAMMEQARNWFNSSERTLLMPSTRSRVIVVGTRYAVDDVYSDIIAQGRCNYGYPMRDFAPSKKGRWDIYYRRAVENGAVTFPEGFTLEEYEYMQEYDWWTWVTQFQNDPQEAGLAEFIKYDLRDASMDRRGEEWYLRWYEGGEPVEAPLSEFYVIGAGDPAATERYISAKTSRSVSLLLATHHSGRKFIISLHVGYVEIHTMFDWIFDDIEKFGRYMSGYFLETNAGFKVLDPILQKEMARRGVWFNLEPFPAVGEKVARIRSDLDPEFSKSRIHVLPEFRAEVEEETRAFPQSIKKDILDALSIAVRNSIRPNSPEEEEEYRDEEEFWRNRTRNLAGY